MRFRHTNLPRRFQAFCIDFRHIKLNWHRVQIANMIYAPSAKAQEQDFSHRNQGAENFNSAREDPFRCPGWLADLPTARHFLAEILWRAREIALRRGPFWRTKSWHAGSNFR